MVILTLIGASVLWIPVISLLIQPMFKSKFFDIFATLNGIHIYSFDIFTIERNFYSCRASEFSI